jgi:hypothetical protein
LWTNGSAAYDSLIITNSIVELVTMSINNNSISPDNFNLYQNYPNPFNSNTKIKLDIKNKSNIELDIYDLSGKIIKQVFRGSKEVGTYIFSWNSKNSMSVKVTSGVYILKLKVENSQIIKKMVLLK